MQDVSFAVERGELFGLLGPNGAGKTTTVKMLTTLLLPTGGTARVLGMDVRAQAGEVRKRIGFAFSGSRGLYTAASPASRTCSTSPSSTRSSRTSRGGASRSCWSVVGLTGRGDERVETYSSGMVQRLHLARALLHDPDVLFLDEPTVGIDPVGARELRQTVRSLIALGKTVLLTTHYMAEAEELCRRIAIIKQGRIVALDSPEALKRRVTGDSVIEITPRRGSWMRCARSWLRWTVDNVVEVREGADAALASHPDAGAVARHRVAFALSESAIRPGPGSAQPDPGGRVRGHHPGRAPP